MKLYSDIPGRRAVQVAADVGIVLWVVLWVRIAQRVHDATMALAAPGRNLAGAGSSFRDTMTSAGDNVDDLPLLDDRVATPFRSAAGVGTEIEKAGTDLVTAVERVSLLLAVTTALVPDPHRRRDLARAALALRAPRQRRPAVHRRRARPRPVRAARHGEPADAAPGARSPTTRPARGAAVTSTSSTPWPCSSSRTWACARPRPPRPEANPGQAVTPQGPTEREL